MQIRNVLCAMGVVFGSIFQVIGLVTYLLFWRIDNEPGYNGDPLIFAIALGLGVLGMVMFLGGNLLLILHRAKKAALAAWFFVGLVAAFACAISPFVLILMV